MVKRRQRTWVVLATMFAAGIVWKAADFACDSPAQRLENAFDSKHPDSLNLALSSGNDGIRALRGLIQHGGYEKRSVVSSRFKELDAPELLDTILSKVRFEEDAYRGINHADAGHFLLRNAEPQDILKCRELLKQWVASAERDDGLTINLSNPNELQDIPVYGLLRAAEACGVQERLTLNITNRRWRHPVFDPELRGDSPSLSPRATPEQIRAAVLKFRAHHSADQTAQRLILRTEAPAMESDEYRFTQAEIESALAHQSTFDVLEAWSKRFVNPTGATREALNVFVENNGPLTESDRNFVKAKLTAASKSTKMVFDEGLKGLSKADSAYDFAVFYLPGIYTELIKRGLWSDEGIRRNPELNRHFKTHLGAIWRCASTGERQLLRPLIANHSDWLQAAAQQSEEVDLKTEWVLQLHKQVAPRFLEMEEWSDSLLSYARKATSGQRHQLGILAARWAGLDLTYGRIKIVGLLGVCGSPNYNVEVSRYLKSGNAWRQIQGLRAVRIAGKLPQLAMIEELSQSKNFEVRLAVAKALLACKDAPGVVPLLERLRQDTDPAVSQGFHNAEVSKAPDVVKLLEQAKP